MGWSNWSGRQQCAAEPLQAGNPEVLAELIHATRRARGTLRAVGSGHSFVPFWQPGDRLVSLAAWSGLEDLEEGRARLRAGTPIDAIGRLLEPHGRALPNQGDIDRQCLAGAVATGTHGTGAELGSLSAQIAALELIDGTGTPRELAEGETLEAGRVALGLLGLVTHVTLETVANYGLHERSWREAPTTCLAELEARVAAHRHFEFWWVPREDTCIAKSLDPIALPEHPRLDEIPFGEAGERWGASHRIFPSTRELRFNEMEYAVPVARGPACFQAIRQRLLAQFPKLPWPVEYRVVAGDGAWLSPTGGERVATISVHQGAERDSAPLFNAVEPICREHGGRPHWGKLHGLERGALETLYPRHADFVALRRAWDPDAIFLNSYLHALFG